MSESIAAPQNIAPAQRLMSLDALRGFDMFWIIGAEDLFHALNKISDTGIARGMAEQLEHEDWEGFHFYDLIFPLFVFIVGVSLVFSLSKTIETVGRAAERAELRAAFESARTGRGMLFSVAGEPGIGKTTLVEECLSELAATGETARRRDVSTLDELTPQELHIAQLLAGGRTTRQAAAALFLSPKTIEYHLRSVYRKLDVNSRQALAKALQPR